MSYKLWLTSVRYSSSTCFFTLLLNSFIFRSRTFDFSRTAVSVFAKMSARAVNFCSDTGHKTLHDFNKSGHFSTQKDPTNRIGGRWLCGGRCRRPSPSSLTSLRLPLTLLLFHTRIGVFCPRPSPVEKSNPAVCSRTDI